MSDAESWRVEAEASGARLDVYLAARLALPRNRILGWIRDGRVELDGELPKPSHRLAGGEAISCRPRPVTQPADLRPEVGPLRVLHEDRDLLVIAKPAGLAVHPGAGRTAGTLANRLLAAYPEIAAVGGPGRPGIVHRLDRDTTGVLVIARTPEAWAALSAAFAERRVEKTYLAVAYGAPRTASGTIDLPIGRHPQRRKEMTVRPRGRPARTHYTTVEVAAGIALLKIGLETGRTHQIRVHLKAVGHPLVGDPVYGEARWKGLEPAVRGLLRDFPRPALHAWRIAFRHPRSSEPTELTAPPPDDLRVLWERVSRRPFPVPPGSG